MNKTKTVIIGISSGIAGYKTVDLINQFRKEGIKVAVIMTANAVKMFGTVMFEKASGNKIFCSLIPDKFDYREVVEKKEVEHIKLADKASLIVLAPATSNLIAKTAHGFADDYLTTLLLAATCPVVVCPSMNSHMWQKKSVKNNLEVLRKTGYRILAPDSGQLACGYIGVGRLTDINKIFNYSLNILKEQNLLKGKKVLVTAGGTIEKIDAARIITNRSSGKMGLAIARACQYLGAQVLLLRSVGSKEANWDIKEEKFTTVKDLDNLLQRFIKRYDIIFHLAAVSDFIPEKEIEDKIDSTKSISLTLVPAVKLINNLKKWNSKVMLVGFKAVYRKNQSEIIKIAAKCIQESKADYLAVNDIGREGIGFEAADNEITLISKSGKISKLAKKSKDEIALELIKNIFHENKN